MYGIIAYLDKKTEDKIHVVREGMKEARITEYDMRPHVTIATHLELDLEDFKEEFNQYFKNEKSISLFFPSLGMFLNSGTLYAAPTKDPELTDFHTSYHEQFKKYVDPTSLYAPKHWVPHCTIASHLSHEKLVQAFDWSAENMEPFYGRIESIALLELDFEAEVCTDVKDICEVPLKIV
ncbi:2'-5' RNA ligase family protein [Fictibacillus nanhaiensis]|uniref:2'-5' RNA ligase family protein n=1 Tax=Fictibacillus nanhaiensis TaxID=742169 RepID=UPI001C95B715|nr:2'-5' RNA ligase family protein [Fictibacillus nanhaiensis]MBY6037779.1 2'-5' RNA ligase family protein [Fictibacillus nanhaiensis]